MAGPISEHSLSADAIKAIVAKYGKRLKFIKTENNSIAVNQTIIGSDLYIDPTDSSVFDYETFDNYEFIKVKSYDPFMRKTYTSLIRINDIRTFVIADNETDSLDGFRC